MVESAKFIGKKLSMNMKNSGLILGSVVTRADGIRPLDYGVLKILKIDRFVWSAAGKDD